MKQKHFLMAVLVFLALFSIITEPAKACTTFIIQKGKNLVVGKSFDFHSDTGMVIVNQRNVSKSALLKPGEKPVQWVSKYGSVTFNQVSREFPFSGINEAGLVVEIMWLQEVEYPALDERPGITESQWIQYQLDNFSSVDEVIKSDWVVRITQSSPVHFLVGDATGKAVTIEFLKGKLVYHTGKQLPTKVLTNNTYAESLQFLKNKKEAEYAATSNSERSLARFARAAKFIKDYRPKSKTDAEMVEYAFKILSSVKIQDYTVWNIVYDVPTRRIHFRTVGKNKIKTIRLKDLNFACGLPVKGMDINTDLKGDVTGQFGEYTDETNRALVFATFKNYRARNFMTDMSDFVLDILAKYPASNKCK